MRSFLKVIGFGLICCAVNFSCSEKSIIIVPLTYQKEKWKEHNYHLITNYYYAIKNYSSSSRNKYYLDTFVLNRVPREYLAANYEINFMFFQYTPGQIDENIEYDSLDSKEILNRRSKKFLVSYLWIGGKFQEVEYCCKDGNIVIETRNW